MVTTSDFRELSTWGTAVETGSQSYNITLPHIVNHKKIRTGEKVVLKWTKESADKEKQKVPKSVTAFDNLSRTAKTQRTH